MSQKRYGMLALTLLLFCILLHQAASIELPEAAVEKGGGWRLAAHLEERSEALIQAGRELQPILSQGEIRRGQDASGMLRRLRLLLDFPGALLFLALRFPAERRRSHAHGSSRKQRLIYYIQCTDLP